MTAVSLSAAARELGISESTARRDVRSGAPVVRTGGAGRGHGAMVDLDKYRAWHASNQAVEAPASEVSERIAETLLELHRQGLHRLAELRDDVAAALFLAIHERFVRRHSAPLVTSQRAWSPDRD